MALPQWHVPFTPSHVAAVLPFARTPLIPAALAIGSMTPDLFYFVPVDVERGFSHSLLGAVTLDLGVGLLVLTLWQLVFRRPAADFTPYWLRARLPRSSARPSAGYAAIAAASGLVGIATHLAWDALTHEGWLTDVAPFTAEPVAGLPLVKWLQHTSSLLGVLIVGVWFVLWVRRTPEDMPEASRLERRRRIAGWIIVIAPPWAVGLGYWLVGIAGGASPVDPDLVFRVVRICIGGAALLAVVACLGWWSLRTHARVGSERG